MTVCSGNICRSPLAQLMIADGLADISGFVVESAGTIAKDDQEMPEQAQVIARGFGLEPAGHRARYLTEDVVVEADVLLAMSRSHRSEIVRHAPSKISKTFTVREFARLASGVTDEQIVAAAGDGSLRDRVAAALRLVVAQKASSPRPTDPELDDVIDPYRRDDSVYRQSADELEPAVGEVVRVLRLASGAGKH
nr:low molecular weight phosphatase family protein [Herbiconiux sp. VKM Ac-1786]